MTFSDARVSDYAWLYADELQLLNQLFIEDQRKCETAILSDLTRFCLHISSEMNLGFEFSDQFYAKLMAENDLALLHENWKIIARRMTKKLTQYCQVIREMELGLTQKNHDISEDLTRHNDSLYRLIHILEYLLDRFDIKTQISAVLDLLEGMNQAYPMKFILWLQNSKIQPHVQDHSDYRERYETIMRTYQSRV